MRNRLQRWISGGFDPPEPREGPVFLVLADGTPVPAGAPAARRLAGLPPGGLGVLLPSYVARCGTAQHVAAVTHVLDRLRAVRAAHPTVPLTLWVGMQSDDPHASAAVRRLREIADDLPAAEGVTVVGLAVAGRGKMRTINAAVRAAADLGYLGWVWVDDDVELDPDCLRHLVGRFLDRGATGAVGGCHSAMNSPTVSSRVMDAVSQHTVPPYSYPAAACMVVATPVVAGGIPGRRLTDDGFVLFELLAAVPADEPADFDVVAEAHYRYYRVGRSADTLLRLRRSMYSHVTCMADYPWHAARRYFSRFLFYGLWPLAPWDGRRGPAGGLVRWGVKGVHFGWFCAVATNLAVRNLLGRPVRHVGWGDDGDYRTPLDGPPPDEGTAAPR